MTTCLLVLLAAAVLTLLCKATSVVSHSSLPPSQLALFRHVHGNCIIVALMLVFLNMACLVQVAIIER